MPRQKYEGEIYLISSDVTDEMQDVAARSGINGVFLKSKNREFDDLIEQQRGKNVALVDDTPIVALGISRLLESRGASVTVYNYPDDALKDIQGHIPPFAVVFTDFNMPIIDGMQLAVKLRAGELV